MRFLVDENLPAEFAALAIQSGHAAARVRDLMSGATDREILDRLRATGEMLVTRDVRFANLVLALMTAEGNPGMVVLVREQLTVPLTEAWERFLASPREVRGIAVLTAKRIRYRSIGASQE